MNHPKTYFATPLSKLAKLSTNNQMDDDDELLTINSPLTIIQSCLSKTIVEDFVVKPSYSKSKQKDWKDQFVWL
ncbi:unnamed protein product [Paramecium sonneborni]|uniref:Uncharacterized protein n=1 Tax=Paramecium sonneborni TaxID=65129 RepID=A0A8S1MZJ8_9CILI|nr:unnamed protein product [Paramecium sonneborni]